jgi:hypothetical protein
MARLARVVAQGVAHHATQRGNARRYILGSGYGSGDRRHDPLGTGRKTLDTEPSPVVSVVRNATLRRPFARVICYRSTLSTLINGRRHALKRQSLLTVLQRDLFGVPQ